MSVAVSGALILYMIDNEKLTELEKMAHELTTSPGVYLMYDKNDTIIYVGKAKNLKNRVSSYFRSVEKHTPKVYAMVSHVEYFKTILATSEFEALVLECAQIKEHNPKYNILLKDDKGYCYLKVGTESYPRLSLAYRKDDKKAKYIGPYISSIVVKETLDEANKLFGLPTCKTFPKRPCLNYHIKQCMGVCKNNISIDDYNAALEQAIDFINGGTTSTLKLLNKRMNEMSSLLNFEEAARCRDRIKALESFNERQRVVYKGLKNCDFIAAISSENSVAISVLKFRNEYLKEKQDFFFPNAISIENAREEFLTSFYEKVENKKPDVVYIDEKLSGQELYEKLLDIKIICPQKGEHKKIIEMARHNAAEKISTYNRERSGKEIELLDELKGILGIKSTPIRIESFDISNFGSDTIVGAMVVYENGKQKKSDYRKFIIKRQTVADDYAAMKEMLSRRLQKYIDNDDSFNKLPDLWLIDGGFNHVAIARKVVEEFKLNIPVFGMVKDNNHRTRALATDGQEVIIYSHKSIFNFITAIQDETHRFAISFARKKHSKKILGQS